MNQTNCAFFKFDGIPRKKIGNRAKNNRKTIECFLKIAQKVVKTH